MARTQYQNGIAAAHLIDESGMVDMILTAVHTNRRGRRPNIKALRLFLIGSLLAVHTERTGTVEAAWQALEKLDVGQQLAIGFHEPRHDGDWIGEPVTDRRAFYLWSKKIGDGLAYGDADTTHLDEQTRTARRATIQQVVSAGLGVFAPWWDGDVVVVDATGIHAWGRPPVKANATRTIEEWDEHGIDVRDAFPGRNKAATTDADDQAAAPGAGGGPGTEWDRDACWSAKTKPTGGTESFYGYFEHCLVLLVGAKANRAPVAPRMRLVVGLEVTPAHPGLTTAVTLELIDRLPFKIGTLIADRFYSYAKVESWCDPLIERDIDVVYDMREDQHGFIEVDRMRACDGDLFCPGTPDAYGRLSKPGPNAPAEQMATFRDQVSAREAFQMRRHTSMNKAHKCRVECPARAGKVGCPLVPGSVETAIELGLRIVEHHPDPNSPEGLPTACTQETVLVKLPDKVRKIHQKYPWGSPTWFIVWAWRSFVEGVFGERKNPSAENMNRGIFRIRGVARVNLSALFTAMSHNLRAIRRDNEMHEVYGPEHPLFRPVGGYVTVAVPADLDTNTVAHPAASHAHSGQVARSA